jgi:spermidine synthase
MNKTKLYISSLFILGFSTFLVQVLFLREYLAVYNGNELGIGLFLGCWMFSNATGAFFGNRFIKNIEENFGFMLLHFLLGIIPFVSSFLGFYLKGTFFHAGQMLGLSDLLWINFVFLFPFCFVAGTIFPFASFMLSDLKSQNEIGKSYAFESVGAVVAAILVNILVLRYASLKVNLIINLAINFIVFGLYFIRWKGFYAIKSLFVLLILASVFIAYNMDYQFIIEKYLYKNQKIEHIIETKYGSLIVTNSDNQQNVFLNNSLLWSANQLIENEEKVHFAMLQSKAVNEILVIGSCEVGMFYEIMKYNVNQIDFIEPNKKLYEIEEKPDIVNHIAVNPVQYLKKNKKKYDVVFLNSGNPQTITQSTFLSSEFIQMIKNDLSVDGIFMTYIDVNYNYLSDAENELTSIVYTTILQEFKHIKIIPGEHLYFVSSDKELNKNYLDLIHQHDISNKVVNEYYIDDDLLTRKANLVEGTIDKNEKSNSSFTPNALNASLKIWGELSGKNYLFWITLLLLCAFSIYKMEKNSFPVFIAGFTGTSIQTILIIIFQIYFGSIYHYLGFIIGLFMLGIFLGSYFTKEKELVKKNRNIKGILVLVCLEFLMILYGLKYFDLNSGFLIKSFIFIHSLMFGVIIGRIFTIITFKSNKSLIGTSSSVYGLDMLGATLGAIVITTIIIPQLGILAAAILLLILNSLIFIFNR